MDKNILKTNYPCKRLKFVVSINDDSLAEDTDPDFEINYIDIGNVDSSGKINEIVNYKFSEAPSRARRKVQNRDIIVSTVRTYLRAIAPIDNEVENLIVSTGFAVIRPNKDVFNSDFCKYALIESSFIDEVQKRSVGISYPAINASDLGDIFIPFPSLDQQSKIVAYLDIEISKIDALIEKKTRLIELLEENKKAVINQAVTKGLDLNVLMKDTGVEWLGEIPQHWELVKLKYLTRNIDTGSTPKGFDIPIDESNDNVWNWFTPGDLQNDFNILKDAKRKLSNNIVIESNIRLYDSNTVMFVGIGATLGKVAVTDSQFYTNQQMNIIELKEDVNKNFIAYSLSSKIAISKMLANSATLPILNQQKLGDLVLAIPANQEQSAIVYYISKLEIHINKMINKISSSIDLLKEKRTAIISAAINGEIEL